MVNIIPSKSFVKDIKNIDQTNREKLEKQIKKIIKNGCLVVMSSQCVFGRVQMHVYSDAIDLTNVGVISGKDMLAETAFIKLAWLLGNYKKDEVKDLIGENLRGEINERLMKDAFLE